MGVVEGSREQQVLIEAKQRSESLQVEVDDLIREKENLTNNLEGELEMKAQMEERHESEKEALNSLLEKAEKEKHEIEENLSEKLNLLEAQLRQKAEENEVNKISLLEALKERESALEKAEKDLAEVRTVMATVSEEVDGLKK